MEMIRRAVVAVGSVLMGPGNWSMSVKLEKASSAATGRHVNVAEPLRWVHYGPSHTAFSHQKSHQCIKRYSLGTDKLILSSFFPWLIWIIAEVSDGQKFNIIIHRPSAEKYPAEDGNYYCNTTVFSKSIIWTNILPIWSEEMELRVQISTKTICPSCYLMFTLFALNLWVTFILWTFENRIWMC